MLPSAPAPIKHGKSFDYETLTTATIQYKRPICHRHGSGSVRRQRRPMYLVGYREGSCPRIVETTGTSIERKSSVSISGSGIEAGTSSNNSNTPFSSSLFSRFFDMVTVQSSNTLPHFHVSHQFFITLTLFVLCVSLALSLWWSVAYGDVSEGFDIGSYVATVAGVPITVGALLVEDRGEEKHIERPACYGRDSLGLP